MSLSSSGGSLGVSVSFSHVVTCPVPASLLPSFCVFLCVSLCMNVSLALCDALCLSGSVSASRSLSLPPAPSLPLLLLSLQWTIDRPGLLSPIISQNICL